MRSLEETLVSITQLIQQQTSLEEERRRLDERNLPPTIKEDIRESMGATLAKFEGHLTDALKTLVRFPPYHVRHTNVIGEFLDVSPFERSVFVMTKYPDGKVPEADQQLTRVIEAVRETVATSGFVPRLASDHSFHPGLWDNVELYLLGCSRAIAIVEGKTRGELNPNVAMEWGWMVGSDRKVLYLVEESFDLRRADWSGLLESRFPWENPAPAIQRAVGDWLKQKD
jgi:hypothetical protein